MNNYIIETKQLSKDFSGEAAVNQLSIQVRKNEIYGFLGPNGAGKSTAMKMLLGLLQPTHGSIRLFDKNFDSNQIALLSSVGSLIEEPSYYANLTGYENLEIIQRLLKLPKENIDKVLKIVKLYEQKDKYDSSYPLKLVALLLIILLAIFVSKKLIGKADLL